MSPSKPPLQLITLRVLEACGLIEEIGAAHEADLESDEAARVFDRAWAPQVERRLEDLEAEVDVMLRRKRA